MDLTDRGGGVEMQRAWPDGHLQKMKKMRMRKQRAHETEMICCRLLKRREVKIMYRWNMICINYEVPRDEIYFHNVKLNFLIVIYGGNYASK